MWVVGYVLLSFLVALNGRNRRYGFIGALFMSYLLTPPLALLILWVTAPRRVQVPTVVYRTVPADRPVPPSPGNMPRTAGSRYT